ARHPRRLLLQPPRRHPARHLNRRPGATARHNGRMTDEGGDAACWAHLFADESSPGSATQLAPLLAAAHEADGVQWSLDDSTDLNVNLVRLGADGTIARHINAEVDVAVIVLAGGGTLHCDAAAHELAPL